MRCEKVRVKIDAYLTGELSPQDHAAVEEHTKACDSCRAAVVTARKLTRLGQAASVPPIPEGFAQRLRALARQRIARPTPLAATWNPAAWWRTVSMPMRAAAAAVLVVGLATGVLMGWDTGQAAAAQPAPLVSQSDPLAVYNMDYLTDAPNGSLAESYLALVSDSNGRGR